MARDNKNNGKSQDAGANLNLPALLASIGQAVSPEGSWQEQLGGTAKGMAEDEQSRQFLSGLLGGNMPEIKGQIGLDPNTVLEGVKTKAAMTPEPEEPMTQVTLPNGKVTQVPQSEAADFERKVWAEQHSPKPSGIREFEEYNKWDADKQKAFQEYAKTQRGMSFDEAMARFAAKRRLGDRLDAELELGTPEHLDEIKKDTPDSEVSKLRTEMVNKGRPMSWEAAQEIYTISKAARDIENRRKEFNKVEYRKNGQRGPGFYGITKDGKTRFIQRHRSKF